MPCVVPPDGNNMDDVRSETTSEDNQEARNEPVDAMAHGPRPPTIFSRHPRRSMSRLVYPTDFIGWFDAMPQLPRIVYIRTRHQSPRPCLAD